MLDTGRHESKTGQVWVNSAFAFISSRVKQQYQFHGGNQNNETHAQLGSYQTNPEGAEQSNTYRMKRSYQGVGNCLFCIHFYEHLVYKSKGANGNHGTEHWYSASPCCDLKIQSWLQSCLKHIVHTNNR